MKNNKINTEKDQEMNGDTEMKNSVNHLGTACTTFLQSGCRNGLFIAGKKL